MTSSTIGTTTTTSQAPILLTTISSDIIQNLPSFDSLFRFDDRLRSLEENFSEVMQTNQFAGAVSTIPGIVQHYMDQWMNEAVKVAVQIQSDRLREEAQRENDEFLRTVDENIKKIIKEQVKEQVKVQVSKILLRIEQAVNEQLKAEVLTRSSHSSRTSYAVADDLSEMEPKKILIEKMEGNKEDTMTMTMKIRMKNPPLDQTGGQRDAEKVKSPSQQVLHQKLLPGVLAGADDQPIVQSSQHPEWFSQQQKPPTLDRAWNKTLPAVHGSIQLWISELAKQADTCSSFNELMDTPLDFSNFLMNRLRVDILTPELLAEPTYELMKGSCKNLIELEYHLEEVYKAIIDQLDWVNPKAYYGHIKWIEDLVPRTMWIQEPIDYDKHALWGVSYWGRKRQQLYGFTVNPESARDVYSKRRIIVVTKLKIVEWHSYKHLDWIMVRRDDDKLYKFKEGDFKRLHIQDIEDMLLLLVQGKLTNLTVEERFAFNVSLRMFTRSIVI
nr:hypothetical protein [Tanacetum cinerariifolium]